MALYAGQVQWLQFVFIKLQVHLSSALTSHVRSALFKFKVLAPNVREEYRRRNYYFICRTSYRSLSTLLSAAIILIRYEKHTIRNLKSPWLGFNLYFNAMSTRGH